MSDPAGSHAAEIGRLYDSVPYEAGAMAGLEPRRLRGAAASFGLLPSPGPALDVLDIGCGGGAQLAAAAAQTTGRLVGIDASAEACARAAARGAALGGRLRILHADAAAMTPAALGRFDVIYMVGTLYVMPEPARSRVLSLAASCLKPGGVAVLTGYTGLLGLARARLAGLLRAANDPSWPVAQQLATARGNLRLLSETVPAEGAAAALSRAMVAGFAGLQDTLLFHEALGTAFDALHASDLASVTASAGVGFLNHLPPAPIRRGTSAREASTAADAWDFASGGGYRTMLFGRPGEGACGPRHPGIAWSTSLVRSESPGHFIGPDGQGLHAETPDARETIEALIAGPCDGAVLPEEAEGLLFALWGLGAAWPEWR